MSKPLKPYVERARLSRAKNVPFKVYNERAAKREKALRGQNPGPNDPEQFLETRKKDMAARDEVNEEQSTAIRAENMGENPYVKYHKSMIELSRPVTSATVGKHLVKGGDLDPKGKVKRNLPTKVVEYNSRRKTTSDLSDGDLEASIQLPKIPKNKFVVREAPIDPVAHALALPRGVAKAFIRPRNPDQSKEKQERADKFAEELARQSDDEDSLVAEIKTGMQPNLTCQKVIQKNPKVAEKSAVSKETKKPATISKDVEKPVVASKEVKKPAVGPKDTKKPAVGKDCKEKKKSPIPEQKAQLKRDKLQEELQDLQENAKTLSPLSETRRADDIQSQARAVNFKENSEPDAPEDDKLKSKKRSAEDELESPTADKKRKIEATEAEELKSDKSSADVLECPSVDQEQKTKDTDDVEKPESNKRSTDDLESTSVDKEQTTKDTDDVEKPESKKLCTDDLESTSVDKEQTTKDTDDVEKPESKKLCTDDLDSTSVDKEQKTKDTDDVEKPESKKRSADDLESTPTVDVKKRKTSVPRCSDEEILSFAADLDAELGMELDDEAEPKKLDDKDAKPAVVDESSDEEDEEDDEPLDPTASSDEEDEHRKEDSDEPDTEDEEFDREDQEDLVHQMDSDSDVSLSPDENDSDDDEESYGRYKPRRRYTRSQFIL
ncbi:hypothetical protein EDC01DRAFT_753685 [Geopyxis carbonaria]|nr:hypothetical protein EDC01DRAFT_753685 [Geopyxis carbonaria]